jgi:4-carboxymuconolactone decarboxylase
LPHTVTLIEEEQKVPRIPLISTESDLTAEQRRVVDGILGRRGGRIPGPFRLSLHCPAITEAWHPLGETLRLKSGFPLRLSELTILLAARLWDCDYVFNSHAPIAIEGGLSKTVVAALQKGGRPAFDQPDEAAIYDYCTELFERHAVSDTTYSRAQEIFGVPGVVELTALFGYYTMVAMTILAHQMPVPGDAKFRLERKA